MVKKETQKRKWYSPVLLAERANDGFLGIVRSTGAVVGQVEKGTSLGASSVMRLFKPSAAPSAKSPPARPAPPVVKEVHDKAVAALRPKEAAVAPARPREEAPPLSTAPVAAPVVPDPVVAQVAPPPVAKVEAAAAPVEAPVEAVAAPVVVVEAPVLETAAVEDPYQPPGTSWWRRPKVVKKDAAPKAPERAPAAPARGWKAHETATSIDSWLDSLALADLSQQVQMRSAVDDLVRGSELVRRSAARLLVSLGLAAEPVFVECARSASPMVVETCLESLSELGSKWLVQLLPHIAASQDEALRLVALRVVQHLALEVRKPLLLGALRDPQPTVRRRALTYLGWQHASWAKAEILRLCYDADPTVKWAALESLAAIEPAEARARLDSMYPGMDPVLRRRAVRLLERQLRPPNEGFGSPSREERPVRRPLEGKGQNG